MAESLQLETFTAGTETVVDVAAIERQLGELWRAAGESDREPARRSVTRACLFNFVVWCETEASRDDTTQTISTLTSHHPCRAIVLLVEPERATAALSASISAHCHLAGGGGKQVCCEQISISAAGAGVAQLTGALLPLLESDLPTVVWWRGDFLAQPVLFGRLAGVADRVIFDTATWPDPESRLTGLALGLAAHSHCQFADLSWTRLNQWRALTAACFDDVESRAELVRIEAVRIVHGRGPGASLHALLFAGWFAAQLNWAPRDAMARIHRQTDDDTGADATAAGDAATAGGLLAVELQSPSATFRIHKNHGEQTATVAAATGRACGLPQKCALAATDDAALISQELDHLSRHVVYERALEMAAALAAAGHG